MKFSTAHRDAGSGPFAIAMACLFAGVCMAAGVGVWALAEPLGSPFRLLATAAAAIGIILAAAALAWRFIVLPARQSAQRVRGLSDEADRLCALLADREELSAARTGPAETRSAHDASAKLDGALLGYFGAAMDRLAAGDLDVALRADVPGPHAALKTNFNKAVCDINELVRDTGDASREIGDNAETLQRMSQALLRFAARLDAHLQKAQSAGPPLCENHDEATDALADLRHTVTELAGRCDSGRTLLCEANASAAKMKELAGQIGDFVAVVDDVAYQTNLLAINAGIEAARAGETGKGFAVIADEIRQLSRRSATSADDVRAIVRDCGAQADAGTRHVDAASAIVTELASALDGLGPRIAVMATALDARTGDLRSMLDGTGEVEDTARRCASMSARVQRMSRELATLAKRQDQFLARYRTQPWREDITPADERRRAG